MTCAIPAGDSQMLMTLDEVDMPRRQNIMLARFYGKDGKIISRAIGYLEIERKLNFKKAKLKAQMDGETIVITSDCFARSIEITAGENEDEFGWLFEDNYFDLFPFEEKRIKVIRRGGGKQINMKAQYSPYKTIL